MMPKAAQEKNKGGFRLPASSSFLPESSLWFVLGNCRLLRPWLYITYNKSLMQHFTYRNVTCCFCLISVLVA